LTYIHGVAMIGHCCFRSKMSPCLNEVYIATCNEKISDYAKSISAPCVMTKDTHERASDRIAEAMLKIEANTGNRHDIVVLIQGDEPMLHPDMINATNRVAPIYTPEGFEDPNGIKVAVNSEVHAVYFSREPIPSRSKWDGNVPMLKQI
jgi:3-deoxy-manno-octulosonate cytidylyltransferase (CMP-KDO synthetase)